MRVERSEDQLGIRHHLPLFSETGHLIVLELAERTASDPPRELPICTSPVPAVFSVDLGDQTQILM